MKKTALLAFLALSIVAVSSLAIAQINPKNGQPAGPASLNRLPVQNLGPGSPYCSPGQPLPIPDNNPGGATDSQLILDSFTITDLDVSLLITHTWVGDLNVTLDHVGGCGPFDLLNRVGDPGSGLGCSSNNIDATLNDEGADGNAEDQCDATPPAVGPGEFVAGDPPDATLLANCDGDNINGTWNLTITDNAGGDTGTLDQWCLITTPVPVEVMEFTID